MSKYLQILSLLFLSSLSLAQVNVSKVSFDLGYTSNFQDKFGNEDIYVVEPEFKIGGKFIKEYFEWDFNFSFWDDGVKKAFSIMDAVTYSYSSQRVGLRFNYFPKNILIPFHFTFGSSVSFIKEEYIGGSDFSGNSRKDNNHNLLMIDFGLGFNFRVLEYLRLRSVAKLSYPIIKNDFFNEETIIPKIKLGLDFIFK